MELYSLLLTFSLSCGICRGEVPVPQDDGSGLDLTGWAPSGSDLPLTGPGLGDSNRVTFVSPSPPSLQKLYFGTEQEKPVIRGEEDAHLQMQTTQLQDTEKSSGRGLSKPGSYLLELLTAPFRLSGLTRYNFLPSFLGKKKREAYTPSESYTLSQSAETRASDYEDMFDLTMDSDSTAAYKRKRRPGPRRGRKRRRRRRRKPRKNRFRRPKPRPHYDDEDSREDGLEKNIIHPVKTSYSYVTHHHDLKNHDDGQGSVHQDKGSHGKPKWLFRNLFSFGGQKESGDDNNKIQESFKFNKIRSDAQKQKMQLPKSIYDKLQPAKTSKTFHPSPMPTIHIGIMRPPIPPPTPPFQSYSFQYVAADNSRIPAASFTSSSLPTRSYPHSAPSGMRHHAEFDMIPEIPDAFLTPPLPFPRSAGQGLESSGEFQASFSNRYPRVFGYGTSQYHSPPPSPLPVPMTMLMGPTGRPPMDLSFYNNLYYTTPFRRMHVQQSPDFMSNRDTLGTVGHNPYYENLVEAESAQEESPVGSISPPQIIYGKWNPLLDNVETTAESSHSAGGSNPLDFHEDVDAGEEDNMTEQV